MKTAKEMIMIITSNPKIDIETVLNEMPLYKNQLHKNQWISNVFKHLPEDLKKRLKKEFDSLKK